MHGSLKALPLCLALACGSATDPTSGPYGFYCAPYSSSDGYTFSRPSFPSQSSSSNLKDDWAWLATHVPGCWSGAYVEPADSTRNAYGAPTSFNLVLLLVDTTQLSGAIDSIRVYQPSLLTQTPGVVAMRAQKAQWSLLQLYEWDLYAESSGFGWTEAGIDFSGNRVLMGVKSSADSAAAISLLNSWHAPADLFHVVVESGTLCDCTGASTCC